MKKIIFLAFTYSFILLCFNSCQKSQLEKPVQAISIDPEIKLEKRSGVDCCINCNATVQIIDPIPTEWELKLHVVCPGGPGVSSTSELIGIWDETDNPVIVIPGIYDEHTHRFRASCSFGAMSILVQDQIATYQLFLPDNVSEQVILHCDGYTASECWKKGNRVCCLRAAEE